MNLQAKVPGSDHAIKKGLKWNLKGYLARRTKRNARRKRNQ